MRRNFLLAACLLLSCSCLVAQIDTSGKAEWDQLIASGYTPVQAFKKEDWVQDKIQAYYVNIRFSNDSFQRVTAKALTRYLEPGEVFIDFHYLQYMFDYVYFATVIRKDSVCDVVVIPSLRGKPVAKTTEIKNEPGRGIQPGQAFGTSSFYEYENLLRYLAPFLKGIQTIYYSTAHQLNLVNLKCLRDKDGIPLSQKYRMIRLHSGASFVGGNKRLLLRPDRKVLAIGAVDFDCPSDGDASAGHDSTWSRLPGTARELDAIRRALGPSGRLAVLDSCRATEENLFETCKQGFDLLHFATHGFYYPAGSARYNITAQGTAWRSGLVLSGANDLRATAGGRNRHGLFTPAEFSGLHLTQTRLVVLSSCFSGIGEGETIAPLGLLSLLLDRGVQGLMVSNGAIPDDKTTLFMGLFYQNLARSNDVDDCFQRALCVMQSRDPATDWSFIDLVH